MNAHMWRIAALLLVVGAELGVVDASPAATNGSATNTARVRKFAKLPYWPGLWFQISSGLGGFPIGPSGHEEPVSPATLQIGNFHPPFTPAWQQQMQSEAKMHPTTDRICAFAFPWLMEATSLPFEVDIRPEETNIIFNDNEVRHIYTDGNGHVPYDSRLATPWGDSIGHWEGGTLVVETVSTLGRLLFNDNGKLGSTVLSDQAVYHERIRMISADTLEDRFTIEDPVALKSSWGFVRHYHRIPNTDRMTLEQDCGEGATNDRNPVVDGQTELTPPTN